MSGDLVALAREFVELHDRLDAVRNKIRLAVLNGAGQPEKTPPGEVKPNPQPPRVRAKRARSKLHPNAVKFAEVTETILNSASPETVLDQGDRGADPGQDLDHSRAAEEADRAGPRRQKRPRRLRAPRLSAEQVADLCQPASVTFVPWLNPLYASTSPEIAGRVKISDVSKAQVKRHASEAAEVTKVRFRKLAVVAIKQRAGRRQAAAVG